MKTESTKRHVATVFSYEAPVAIWRLKDESGRTHLCVRTSDSLVDLTQRLAEPPLGSLLGLSLEKIRRLVDQASRLGSVAPAAYWTPVKPVDIQEIWAAGVTYQRSREARIEETESSRDVYQKVYGAERPELFFKATPGRTVGDGEEIVIRGDSRWDVPEPELAVVLNRFLEVVGYSVGNDVSSRDIEGENPLYLPQAKIYQGSCSLGPCIVPSWHLNPADGIDIELRIERDTKIIYSGNTNTSLLRKQIATLVEYLGRENVFPRGVILLTGTGIVPSADVTLQHGDIVEIRIEAIGTLRNIVRRGDGRPWVQSVEPDAS